MGSNTAGNSVVSIVIPNPSSVTELYGQLAGKQVGAYKYARFIRPNGTYINDQSKESPAYREGAVFWFGQDLSPLGLSSWKARLIGARTSPPYVQRAFLLYPTYQTDVEYVNVWDVFEDSSRNHVYYQWIPTQVQEIAIAPANVAVDITVTVALIDNDNDTRPVTLTIEAGGVQLAVAPLGATNGNLLNLVKVTLNDVPAGTDTITLTLDSPIPTGDSVSMAGVAANYLCESPER
jgi:hypothetical protein